MYKTMGRVGTSHTDPYGKMKLVAALDFMQDCSIHWMESEPDFNNFLNLHNLAMVLVSRQADISRLPNYGEQVSAVTSIYKCRGYYGYRNTVLYGEDGLPCIKSWSLGAFVKRNGDQMMRVPAEISENLLIDEPVQMEYLDRRIKLPNCEATVLDCVPVRRNDIDFNGHMNNVRYLESALEILPQIIDVSRFRIEYRLSAKPGDMLYPKLLQENGETFCIFENAEGKIFAVLDFFQFPSH